MNQKKTRLLVAAGLVIAVSAVLAGVWLSRATTVTEALNKGQYSIAKQLLLPKAQAGDAEAQNQLGGLYLAGLGVEQDYKAAFGWFLKSGLQGNTSAQINIAHLYRRGLGVPRDHIRAVAWLWHARSSKDEAAENHVKWLTGIHKMSFMQIERAQQLYAKVEYLDPAREKQ